MNNVLKLLLTCLINTSRIDSKRGENLLKPKEIEDMTNQTTEFCSKYNTWNIMLSGERYVQVTFNKKFSKSHVEACVCQQHNIKDLTAEKA